MAMKKTAPMEVQYSQHIPKGRIIMHPNEGFDLGLVTKCHSVDWCTEVKPEEFLKGSSGAVVPMTVELLNECPHTKVRLSVNDGKQMGLPEKAVVFFDGKRLFFYGMKKTPEES